MRQMSCNKWNTTIRKRYGKDPSWKHKILSFELLSRETVFLAVTRDIFRTSPITHEVYISIIFTVSEHIMGPIWLNTLSLSIRCCLPSRYFDVSRINCVRSKTTFALCFCYVEYARTSHVQYQISKCSFQHSF